MSLVAGNEAHSARVGFLYFPVSGRCSRLADAFVHHTTEVGVMFNNQARSLDVSNIVMSDNSLGLGLLPVGSETIGNSSSIHVHNVAFIGRSDNGGTYTTGTCMPWVAALQAACLDLEHTTYVCTGYQAGQLAGLLTDAVRAC